MSQRFADSGIPPLSETQNVPPRIPIRSRLFSPQLKTGPSQCSCKSSGAIGGSARAVAGCKERTLRDVLSAIDTNLLRAVIAGRIDRDDIRVWRLSRNTSADAEAKRQRRHYLEKQAQDRPLARRTASLSATTPAAL